MEVEKAIRLKEALSVLDEAFKRGESVKTGLLSLLKKYEVPMANEIGNTLRRKGWVQNDKDKESGKLSYIYWNGPPVSLKLAEQIRQETLDRRRVQKAEYKERVTPEKVFQEEAERVRREIEELTERIREKNIILTYLESKL